MTGNSVALMMIEPPISEGSLSTRARTLRSIKGAVTVDVAITVRECHETIQDICREFRGLIRTEVTR